MNKRIRFASLLLVLVLVGIQFFRPKENLGPTGGPNDLAVRYAIPADVHALLTAACYDCHSNHTRYPWYAKVQPVAWLLDHDIGGAKHELNFSEFGAYPARRAAHKLDGIVNEVEGGDMPLASYRWMHPEARLTADQRKRLIDWAQALEARIPPE